MGCQAKKWKARDDLDIDTYETCGRGQKAL